MKKIIIIGFILVLLLFFYADQMETGLIQAENNHLSEEVKNLKTISTEAKTAYYQGNLPQAYELYLQALKIDKDRLETLKNLFYLSKERGDLKTAYQYLQKLSEYQPDNITWQYENGLLLFQQGESKKANQVFTTLESLISESTETKFPEKQLALFYYYYGQSEEKLNNLTKAVSIYQQGIKVLPSLALNYIAQANSFKKLGKYEQAISVYKKALSKDYSQTLVYPELADCYDKIGEDKAAFYYWNRSLSTGVEVDTAKVRLNSLEKQHPEFLEEAKSAKEKKRSEINWVKVVPIEDNEIPLVRIGLVENINEISFQAGSAFRIRQNDNIILTGSPQEEWSIQTNASGFAFLQNGEIIKSTQNREPLVLELNDNQHTFVLYDVSYGQGYFWAGNEDRQYRGKLEISPQSGNRFNVINIVNLEEYLVSVVPAEMPAWWPEEALKAQSVAARSYAMVHLNRHKNEGYDLCATVHCAVYKGVLSENKRTTKAVLSTLGEVGSYQGKIIDAVFSSNSGGYSESSAEVWGNNNIYLSGANNMINNDYTFPLEPYRLNEWLISNPASFSSYPKYAGYNTYRWVKVLSGDYFKHKYNLTSLKNIIPLGRSQGGSVENVLLKGKTKEIIIKRDRIRSGLGGLKSNRFMLEKIYKNGVINKVIFFGSGFGHNVGLDQTGAAGMADNGYNYQEIIQHFYQGTNIKQIY